MWGIGVGRRSAAPVISGIVAHLKARFPGASVGEIRQALYVTARNPDSGRTGHFSDGYGWGIVQPLDAIRDLESRFFSCDSLLADPRGLLAYDIDVDIFADGDAVDDDRVTDKWRRRRDVWVADQAGDAWCRVAHNAAHPAWSPDGQQLAFAHRTHTLNQGRRVVSQADIWVMPAAGGPWRRVTDTKGNEYDLDWSTDGRIAYTTTSNVAISFDFARGGQITYTDHGTYEIWVVDPSGSRAPTDLTGHIAGSQFQPSWSPDGTRIAYASGQDGDNDIWVMNADGTGRRNLTTGTLTAGGRTLGDGKEEQPAWSPDGTRIVYVSDRAGGDNDIWVMNADGTGHRNLHDNNNPEWKPAWSPQGDRIVFVHNTGQPDADNDIWTMDAQTGQNWTLITKATADDLRFNAAAESNPAWSPTDKPPPDDRQVKISWGSDATNRPDCPTGETCLNLRYEYIGTWDPAPYTLQCWTNNDRSWTGQWSGRETTGCYYWGEPAHVVIDGIQSNTITWTPPPPDDRQVRILWGSDATSRPDCPTGETCLNLRYEYIGTWDPAPYTLQCWTGNDRSWTGQWSGRETTGCYYWGEPAHVVIDGIRSNTITWTPPPPDSDTTAPPGSTLSTGEASCAIRTDGTVACWGDNEYGAATPPAGIFTQISGSRRYSCGIRTDQTITCWGGDEYGQATPPKGSFTQIATGWNHSCGVKTDSSIACWGANHVRQATPPKGSFTQVAAGSHHSCGIRTGGLVVCWGNNRDGLAAPPAGSFAQIAVSGYHSCGIRTDQTIACWGNNQYGRVTPPKGSFTQIAASSFHSCGIRTDQTIACWGHNSDGQATPPAGSFTQVAVAGAHSCGTRTDGAIICWGENSLAATAPTDTFIQIAAGGFSCALKGDSTLFCWGDEQDPPAGSFIHISHSCGIRTDHTITCWGGDEYGQATPPKGSFTQIATGWNHSCGVKTDSSIGCWGNNEHGQATPPAGSFTQVAAGDSYSCAIRTDRTISCWGHNLAGGQATPPKGSFTQVAAGRSHSCAIRTDRTISCWGDNQSGQATPPKGSFTQVAAGGSHSCAIRTDRTISCWGYKATPPEGSFTQVSAGGSHSCAIRTDRTISCWGITPVELGTARPPGRNLHS